MAMSGLTLPFLSELDPEQAGEGSLDPLRLAPLSDALADEIFPGVTNRMSRVRFLTAIAVSSSVSAGLEDIPPKDGVSTPYLVFEWHLAEAIARRSRYGLPDAALRSVPGINKARAVTSRGAHLSASTYLKTPKVFGFVGVYKRLAIDVGLVDNDLVLREQGDQLVRIWQSEQGLDGFVDRSPSTAGGALARRIERAVTQALLGGAVVQPSGSWLWSQLVDVLRPDGAGRSEKRQLRRELLDPARPLRREIIKLVSRTPVGSDAEVLRQIRRDASHDLRQRLLAIEGYERVAELLAIAFDSCRRMSTINGLRSLSAVELAQHPTVRRVARELPGAFARALARLERLGRYGLNLEANLGRFETPLPPVDFVEELMEHHRRVQLDKLARPWFEEEPDGLFIRSPYTLHREPEITGAYVNPYRVGAVQSLFADLA
jgi:hypothetical protein